MNPTFVATATTSSGRCTRSSSGPTFSRPSSNGIRRTPQRPRGCTALAASSCLDVIPKGTKAGTFDVGNAIKEIQAGRMLFAIDQQQYLQGYLPVVFAMLYVTNLNTVGNGGPGLTGPGIINKANAARVASLAKQGTR